MTGNPLFLHSPISLFHCESFKLYFNSLVFITPTPLGYITLGGLNVFLHGVMLPASRAAFSLYKKILVLRKYFFKGM